MKPLCDRSSSGMALVITLAFVVLIAILIVGLTSAVMIDRPTANSYLERMRASEYARIGTETVVGTLRRHSSAFAASGSGNWVSSPGGLVVSGTAPFSLDKSVALSSGSATGAAGDGAEPDLNIATFRNPANTVLTGAMPSPPALKVAWIYVRNDGSLDYGQPLDTTNKTNPIVGRFAYWADDESSKVNYNLAWTRGTLNQSPVGHPTRVELAALDGFAAGDGPAYSDAIHNAIASTGTYQFFNTSEDARRVELESAGAANALQISKFDVTHYNHDPDTTFFNEPRIVLTTQPRLAGWTFNTNPAYPNQWVGVNGLPSSGWAIVDGKLSGGGRPVFLDINAFDSSGSPIVGSQNVWDPFETVGGVKSVDNAKLTRTLKVLNSYLRRTDWPMAPGSSFQSRFYSGTPERLTQLSLNIIDYVRSKEYEGDPNTGIVIPIRGIQTGTVTATTDTTQFSVNINPAKTAGSELFFGMTRLPKINEIGVWVSSTSVINQPTKFDYTMRVELFLPLNFGHDQIDVSKLYLRTQYYTGTSIAPAGAFIKASEVPGGNTILEKGKCITVTRPMSLAMIIPGGVRPNKILVRFSLDVENTGSENSSQPRVEICPFDGDVSQLIEAPLDAPGVAVNDITSTEADDPRTNSHKDNWKARSSGNTFGTVNSALTVGLTPVDASQDTDGSGLVSAASLYMPPPPKADADTSKGENPGYITSAGELGYIHTGINGTSKGVPWRTLHLQPNSNAITDVPDWAFMDLFTAPVGAALDADYAAKKYVYAPHSTTIGGRINANARPQPFTLDRQGPLAAALQGAAYDSTDLTKKLSLTQARDIAKNIYAHTLGSSGKAYGNASVYDSPGEIVEVKGVADGGEKSEELYRQIANNITTRGNVFTVYSVGQSLKQLPSGKLQILAEQRTDTMIERYTDGSRIRFAPIYSRTLTP